MSPALADGFFATSTTWEAYPNTKVLKVLKKKIHNVWHQSKITKHAKKGEYKTYSQEKSQPIEANPEVT